MIRHEIKIVVEESVDDIHLQVNTPETLRMVEVVGYFEMAKKQYIDSKHTPGPTVYQTPEDNT